MHFDSTKNERVEELEKLLSLEREQKWELQEEKMVLQKQIKLLENMNLNSEFELKWLRKSKQNNEELLTEHIDRCSELEK
jgi:hypothetical protein